jgi:HIRAN domain
MGRYTAHLVGESNYQDAIELLSEGDSIELLHEPENQYDDRAIKAVDEDGSTVGYLERDSWVGRVLIDEGKDVVARVHEIIGGGPGRMLGVVLEILTAKEALDPPPTSLPKRAPSRAQSESPKRMSVMERAALAALSSAKKQKQTGRRTGCLVTLILCAGPIIAKIAN